MPSEQRFPQVVFNLVVLGLGLVGLGFVRRNNKADNATLNTSITGTSRVSPADSPTAPHVRAYLADRLSIVAALLFRCVAAENEHKHSGATETRQSVNAYLREHNLWKKLEPHEAELASLPQGSWTESTADSIFEWVEHVRVLRWYFNFDQELLAYSDSPNFNSALFRTMPTTHIDNRVGREFWEVRAQKEMTLRYAIRFAAELQHRGLLSGLQADANLARVRSEFAGASTDLLVGTKTVEELTDEEVRGASLFAASRLSFLEYLVHALESGDVTAFSKWKESSLLNDPNGF